MADGYLDAKGHVCKIWSFDTQTAVIPLNANEARLLLNAVQNQKRLLDDATEDEKKLMNQLEDNLIQAGWAIERHRKR
jgi:hypothetical protein